MHTIIENCFKRNRATLLVLLIIVIIGGQEYYSIPRESNPDVRIPIIIVSTSLSGISAEDSERLLVKPMEDELRSVENVKEMRSTAAEGRAYVILEFEAGFDNKKALQDVRAKTDDMRAKLPKAAEKLMIDEINLSLFPVLNIALLGKIPERTLVNIAENLQKRLESISNVLSVTIAGTRKQVVEAIINPNILQSYNLNLKQVINAITLNNSLIAGGKLNNGYVVKIAGLLQNPRDIMNIPIKVHKDSIVTIKDVAKVRSTFKDPEGFARVNGDRALVLEVVKRSGSNIIETIVQVKSVIEEAKKFFPDKLKIVYSQDESEHILDMLKDLENSIIFTVILVMIMIMFVMGIRIAAFVALSIPLTFLMSFIILSYLHCSLNIVVLFSLIMSVGMLVDAAIVITEYADRKMLVGVNRVSAYKQAALHMTWPILSSTLTTIAVFLPLLFWPGIVGQFMKYLPITLIVTLGSSFVVALVFVPVIGSMLGKPSTTLQHKIVKMNAIDQGKREGLGPFMARYYDLLVRVLHSPKKFIFTLTGLLLLSVALYTIFGKGIEFFPQIEPERAVIKVKYQGNLSVHQKDAFLKEIEAKILDMSEIKVIYTRSGSFSSDHATNALIGRIQLELVDWQKRRRAEYILHDIEERIKDIKGVIIEVEKEKEGPSGNKPIELHLYSNDPILLAEATHKVKLAMREVKGFTNIEDNIPPKEIAWNIDIDRGKAARFGANAAIAGEFVKLATSGVIVGKYRPSNSNDEIDIIIRFPEEYRSIKQLQHLFINTTDKPVPVSNFLTGKLQVNRKRIDRINGFRVVKISTDLAAGKLVSQQIAKLQNYFAKHPWNPKVTIAFKGEEEDQRKTRAFLAKAFLLAILAVVLILIIEFNSTRYTLITMSAVILSTTGVLIILLITRQAFSLVMCGIGIIALAGVVVNNNILLIDAFQTNLREGLDKKIAIIKAAVTRVRPILLTAGTAVLGLIPMATKLNIDFLAAKIVYNAPSSQWWTQLAITIAGGLTFATILTLFFTPALLLLCKESAE